MRLIDADRLKEAFKTNFFSRVWYPFDTIIDEIEDAETIDAEPVRHGRWDDSFDGITPVCSVCGMSHNCFNRTPEYCPHCGAKMDGETDAAD